MTLTRRRTGYAGLPHPDNWHVEPSFQHGRQHLTPGTPIKIRGERGVFIFQRHVITEPRDRRRRRAEWIDVIGGTPGVVMYRAFRPERIGRVLRRRPVKTVR